MTISKSWFSYFTRAFALFLCTALLLNFVSCSDSTTSQEPKVVTSTYTVRHLLQNLQDDSYTEDEEARETKTGTPGTLTAAAAKTYEGFTAKTFEQETIKTEGTTVVKIYYDRNTYTLSYSSTYGEPPESKTVKYGYELTAADLPVLPDTILSFNGWRLDSASIEAGYTVKMNITLTAKWKAPPSVRKENFNAVIAALTEDSTIVLTGELTDSDLAAIATAIKNSTYKVNLDLSLTTGLTSIPEGVFDNCTKLSGIIIPDSVTSIGRWAFEGCSSLSSVIIPDSVTSINTYAFIRCPSFTTITVDSNNVNYTSIDGVLFNKDATAIIRYPAGKQSTAYTIPDSVTSIGDSAFNSCTALSSIDIPDTVTSIGYSAFGFCTSLSSVTIPDTVTSIDICTFENCTSLSSVTIPNSVTTIDSRAFNNCSALSSVTISDSVTYIGDNAFEGCSALSFVTFTDPTTWYRTASETNWNNKTNGTLTDVSDAATNATYFRETYNNSYWYKLDE